MRGKTMTESRERTAHASGGPRLLRVTWPFLLIVVVLVLLASESLKIVSASRAYVGAESLWSKAQKEAVYSLFRYAQSHAEADYAAYRAAIAVPMGDHRARQELERSDPDLAVAREGFIAGKNDPDDVDWMIMLFRRFRDVSLMHRAIAIWAEGDEHIAELDNAAAELHARIGAGETRPEELAPILVHIDDVNRRLTPLEEAFSRTLGEASRQTQTILEVALVLTAMLLVILGTAMSRRMLRASESLEAQLFAERDRAQVTLRSIAEGVIAADLDGRVETLNTAAQSLTGWRGDDAIGQPLGAVFRIVDGADRREGAIDPMATLLREAATVEWKGNTVLLRRDGSAVDVDASAAPIRDRDGAIIGAVLVFYDVTDDRRFTAQLSHQARHDALTGLPNRREFEHRLARALADAAALDRRHAVLFLDLDRFKEVNDTSGHAAGDALLREIGAVLQRKLRGGDTLARLGGDEFGVLLENCPPESALRIAETLRAAVTDFRFEAQDRRFDLGVSIGLVPITGSGFSVPAVLGAADACCYRAKGSGRNRVCVYQPPQDEGEHRRHG
jgi:diguanylate cyclase (GGDEF)-like protein/PAS domain S-box-containing protein